MRTRIVLAFSILLISLIVPILYLQAQPKVDQIGERLDKLDTFIGELKLEREEKKAEEARIEKKKAEVKKAQEAKKAVKTATALIKSLEAELLKVKKELEETKKSGSIVPTQPPKIIDNGVVPKQPLPNPKTSSIRLENETDEIARVKVNENFFDIEARKIKFVTVPAGQFTYQVLGIHEKPIFSELNEGQVYGLAIRNAPKGVKQDKIDKVKTEDPPSPLPSLPLEEEIPQKTIGGVRLINKNSMTIPFSVNGKTYRVEPSQEILVKVPLGRCTVGITGMTSQVWSYDIVEGTILRLGCSFSQSPSHGYYYPMQGYYPSCGFR